MGEVYDSPTDADGLGADVADMIYPMVHWVEGGSAPGSLTIG